MGSVIYDGDCAFCSSAARFGKARIAPELDFLAYQKTDLGNYGLTVNECEKSLQFVSDDQQICSGARAVAQILISAGCPYLLIGRIMNLPIINKLAQLGYDLVARHRHRLPGGTPTCKLEN
jgi:predicted DCC family thiol-disulfide oxidoreductase YuxK